METVVEILEDVAMNVKSSFSVLAPRCVWRVTCRDGGTGRGAVRKV